MKEFPFFKEKFTNVLLALRLLGWGRISCNKRAKGRCKMSSNKLRAWERQKVPSIWQTWQMKFFFLLLLSSFILFLLIMHIWTHSVIVSRRGTHYDWWIKHSVMNANEHGRVTESVKITIVFICFAVFFGNWMCVVLMVG